jgi:alanyl-tRNA synthetase
VLGDHVEQSGSMVSEDRLRFDFTHFQPLTDKEIARVEEIINDVILQDLPVTTRVMSQADARASGAMALFGEKYSDEVRVITVGDVADAFSLELCGGTHLTRTSQAAQLRILSETGVASGVRRIEAITGKAAYELALEDNALLDDACGLLKVSKDQLSRRIKACLAENKTVEKELASVRSQQTGNVAESLVRDAKIINGVSVVVAEMDADDTDALRSAADQIRDRLPCGVVLLASAKGGKLLFVAMASEAAIKKGIHAGNIIRETAVAAGGGGGGRPDMAQAGGKNIDLLPAALEAGRSAIQKQLGG